MKPAVSAAPFPIVGIGASAGGLEALEKFLGSVPPQSGLAFVVVQHLDPTVEDLLPELLQRVTPMTVVQARDRMKVRPDHVIIIPPNKDMAIHGGTLRLSAPTAARGMRLPIDFFLRSLAEDRREASIGVILSGMGSDGLMGLRAIKEQGGLSLAQAPEGARFPSMPRSVLDAGLVDLVGSAEQLPDKILAYVQHAPRLPTGFPALELTDERAMEKIILLLRARTGQEFTLYKRSTVVRRIERRMGVHQITTLNAYVRFLERNPGELDLLFKELLIGVTSFFRDPALWQTLGETVFPALFQDRPEGKTFRAWVAGCSTGEEAFGLAMVFREALERVHPPLACSLQIFATDLDRDAIARARQGLFKPNIAADVSEQRLARFFTTEEAGFRVRKEIREMVVFAPQNLIMDPPFTRLDLLSCRNLLIYLAPELQKKLMLLFHYSLLPGGLLCLGSSESVGAGTSQFIPLDAKNRLFRRGEVMLAPQALVFPPALASPPRHGAKTEPKMAEAPPNLATLADQVLLQQFSPPAVLVNEVGDIVYISGRTGKYLEPAAGKANWNLFAMAREGLRLDLASALHRAMRQDEPVVTQDLKVGTNGGTQLVTLTVQRLLAPSPLRGLLMVVFRDQAATQGARRRRPAAGDGRVAELEQELNQNREELRNLQAEMQTSQEELKSTNEELQSTNEELQSTNEELTTSKEELQSLNEELQTINAEQTARMDDLARTSSDMKNLLEATDIATVFLDGSLRVARFTLGASRLYKLLPGDVGRPLTDISSSLSYPELAEDARQVLRSLSPREQRVPARDGRWYAVRIMPYLTPDDRIDGLVLTFTDVTEAARMEQQLAGMTGQFQGLLDRLGAGYALCDLVLDDAGRLVDGRLASCNPALTRMLGPGVQAGKTLAEAVPALGPLLAQALPGLPATGEPRPFGQTLPVGAAVLELTGYRLGPDQFVCLFKNSLEPGGLLAASS